MIEDIASLGVRAEDDMRGNNVHPARDRPRVEVMDVPDSWSIEDVLAHMVQIDSARRRLHQDVHAFPEQAHGPRDDEKSNRDRSDSISFGPAGREDDESRHENNAGTKHVAEDFEIRAFHGQALVSTGDRSRMETRFATSAPAATTVTSPASTSGGDIKRRTAS